jgi:hypothetical protein
VASAETLPTPGGVSFYILFYVGFAVQCYKIKLQIPQQAHTGLVEKGEKKKFVFLCHYKGTVKLL